MFFGFWDQGLRFRVVGNFFGNMRFRLRCRSLWVKVWGFGSFRIQESEVW